MKLHPKADVKGIKCKDNKAAKQQKNRTERHLAKRNPELPPTYGRYCGYVS